MPHAKQFEYLNYVRLSIDLIFLNLVGRVAARQLDPWSGIPSCEKLQSLNFVCQIDEISQIVHWSNGCYIVNAYISPPYISPIVIAGQADKMMKHLYTFVAPFTHWHCLELFLYAMAYH